MKTYKVSENYLGKTVINATDANGKVWWVPTDPANSDYAEYLRYTAWVEAGNNPEEFWTVELTQEI
jgi:hypothetical protein